MDLGIILAVAMLVVWAIGALVFDGPGWVHFFLVVGVALLIIRIVMRGDPEKPRTPR